MTCGSCGSQNADGSPVCGRCGQKLGSYKPTLVGERPSVTAGSGPRAVASKAEAALVGETIANRYVIQEMLGRGGVGVVYRAIDRVLGEEIAIKLLLPQPNRDPRELERFKREILTAKKITHPNVVRIDYFGFVDAEEHEAFLAMELLNGGSLAQRVARGPIPVRDAIDISIGICDGLEAAHRKEIVHRDIKPDNVLFDESGIPKLVDFGLARLANSTTRTQGFSGTPFYMAPEQADGGDPTAASDLYSLGVLLFEIFAGRLPFQSDSLVRLVMQHTKEAPPQPRSIRAEIPPHVEAIILQTLEKDPRQRQRSAAEIADALREVKAGRRPAAGDATLIRPMPDSGREVTANKPSAKRPAPPPPTSGHRGKILIGIGAGLALTGLGVLAVAISQDGMQPAPTPAPTVIVVVTPPPTPIETSPPAETIAKTATPRKTAAPAPTRVARSVPLEIGGDRGCWFYVSVDGAPAIESPIAAGKVSLAAGTHRVRFDRSSCPFDAQQPAAGCARVSDTSATCSVTITESTTLVKFHVLKGRTQTAVIQRVK